MSNPYGRGNRIGGRVPNHGVATGPDRKTVIKGPFGERRQLGRFANNGIPTNERRTNTNKFQRGGSTASNNPITQVNLQAHAGQFILKSTSQPYVGPYHIHSDRTYMMGAGKLGATHELKPDEIIIPTTGQ